jgi:hypothetical protein
LVGGAGAGRAAGFVADGDVSHGFAFRKGFLEACFYYAPSGGYLSGKQAAAGLEVGLMGRELILHK